MIYILTILSLGILFVKRLTRPTIKHFRLGNIFVADITTVFSTTRYIRIREYDGEHTPWSRISHPFVGSLTSDRWVSASGSVLSYKISKKLENIKFFQENMEKAVKLLEE